MAQPPDDHGSSTGASNAGYCEGLYGRFPKVGVSYLGPHTKDYSILRSMLGSPYFGKLP